MTTPIAVLIDTETGGLVEKTNPLLSISMLVIDDTLVSLDGFELKIQPPVGTLLEVPLRAFQGTQEYKRKVDYYWNVHTEQRVEAADVGDAQIIGSIAADVNGFITCDESGGWDFSTVRRWMDQGVPLATAEKALCVQLKQYFPAHVGSVLVHRQAEASGDAAAHAAAAALIKLVPAMAYNADFDRRYVRQHMPSLHSLLTPGWKDPCQMARGHLTRVLEPGARKGWNLQNMAKYAGFTDHKAHTALSDCEAALAVYKWLLSQGVADRVV